MSLNYLNYNLEEQKQNIFGNNDVGLNIFADADYLPASFADLTGLNSPSIKPDINKMQNIPTSDFERDLDNSMKNKNLDNVKDWMDTSSVYIENSVEPFRGVSRGTSSGASGANIYLASKSNQNQNKNYSGDGKVSSIFFTVIVLMLILLAAYAYYKENYGNDDSSL
jgi:hypothetical protein